MTVRLRTAPGTPSAAIMEIQRIVREFPGEHLLVIHAAGRKLGIGPKVALTDEVLARLGEFGSVEVTSC